MYKNSAVVEAPNDTLSSVTIADREGVREMVQSGLESQDFIEKYVSIDWKIYENNDKKKDLKTSWYKISSIFGVLESFTDPFGGMWEGVLTVVFTTNICTKNEKMLQ